MTAEGSGPAVFVFDTTNAVLWGEEMARSEGIAVEVVPAPAESDAKCDLALTCRAEDAGGVAAVLKKEGVPFRLWRTTH